MASILDEDRTCEILARLGRSSRAIAEGTPEDTSARQPVHTVYGGAHLFRCDISAKLGATALGGIRHYAPDPKTFADAMGLGPSGGHDLGAAADRLSDGVYARVIEKLEREPVEDFRVDFEDGYGQRSDAEEDGHAVAVAEQLALGMERGTLPPFVGLRIKPLTEESGRRAVRTLDLCIGTLAARTGGTLPSGFVVTLPKVSSPEQVACLVDLLEMLESHAGMAPGSLRLELMIETPQSILDPRGAVALPALVAAARGRCRGAHFGTYDYTAQLGITAAHQTHTHAACDFARHVVQVSLAGTRVMISDGATTVLPTPPHRAGPHGPSLTARQQEENRRTVHAAWRLHADNVRSSLRHGIYQGWDLSPGQLPARYAAVFAFFLEGRLEAGARLKAFVDAAARTAMRGNVFDDAATAHGLINFFLRGIRCGALTEREALDAGVTLEELRGRSFATIAAGRHARPPGGG